MEDNDTFVKRTFKNLLVTGGAGFIGSNFIRYILKSEGFNGRVINLDALTYAGNPHSLEDLEKEFPKQYIFVHGDICDKALVARVFDEYEIDAVCHFRGA